MITQENPYEANYCMISIKYKVIHMYNSIYKKADKCIGITSLVFWSVLWLIYESQ